MICCLVCASLSKLPSYLHLGAPPPTQASLHITPQFSNWNASPLSSVLFPSQTRGPQKPSPHLPCLPYPMHFHLSWGLGSSTTQPQPHVVSSTNSATGFVS